MTDANDQAERIIRRRARFATAMGILFIAMQLSHLTGEGPLRPVQYVALIGWAVWTAVLVLFILLGRPLWRGRAVRELLNDENTDANRRLAFETGFWAMLVAAGVLFASSFYEPLSGRDALHIVVTAGIGVTLLRFGQLEQRALKG